MAMIRPGSVGEIVDKYLTLRNNVARLEADLDLLINNKGNSFSISSITTELEKQRKELIVFLDSDVHTDNIHFRQF
jgi:hypothetical protein